MVMVEQRKDARHGANPGMPEGDFPLVSIIIPCLNEVKHIRDVLDSILAQRYPLDSLEVLIADGLSKDGTREIIAEYSRKQPFIRLLDNPTKSESIGMNIGIRHSRGDIILRMDAHTTYDLSYVPMCVKALREYDADIVGGIWKTVPQEDTLLGKAISQAVSNRFGVGNAYYRTDEIKEPRYVDGVPYGAFWKAYIEKIGLYDERFHRSEDAELYNRVRRAGGKILLVPGIIAYYRARSNLKSFSRHIFANGYLITNYLKIGVVAFYWRHLVPLFFVSAVLASAALAIVHPMFLWILLGTLGAYYLANLLVSLRVTASQRDPRYLVMMPLVFTMLHWSYGLGSLWGLAKALTSKSLWQHLLTARESSG